MLDADGAAAYATSHGLADASPAELANDDGVLQAVTAAVETANEHLSRVEGIKRFTILPDDWTPDSDVLTPTMKLKRKPIAEKYASYIDAMYAG